MKLPPLSSIKGEAFFHNYEKCRIYMQIIPDYFLKIPGEIYIRGCATVQKANYTYYRVAPIKLCQSNLTKFFF